MTLDFVLEIVELALGLLKFPNDALDTLIQIAQKAKQAYHDQAGKPLDQFLILPEEPV
jgi:hypothetical protein